MQIKNADMFNELLEKYRAMDFVELIRELDRLEIIEFDSKIRLLAAKFAFSERRIDGTIEYY